VWFGYAEDATGTWFPIGESVDTPVIDGRLALWDTLGLTDGDYSLMLRVWLQDGRALEAVVSGVRVRNYTTVPTAAPAAEPLLPTATAFETPLPAPRTDSAAAPPAQPVSPFWAGAVGGLLLLSGLAAYSLVAPRVRAHLGHLRMRQLHRRLDRSRARGSRR
jgi:hypothetical protein